MASRTGIKASTTILQTLRCQRCILKGTTTMTLPCVSRRQRSRAYATSVPPNNKKFDLPEEYTEEVFKALANNPPVMQAMHNLLEALSRRGIKLDKEPSVSEMWKIMKDKEIINALTECTLIPKYG